MAQGRGGATQATLAIGLVMLALPLLNGELYEPTKFTVGGKHGWTFNVTNWTDGKTFFLGDILEFKYKKGVHNVVQVNSENYAKCNPENAIKTYSSGDENITVRMGPQYFICGIGKHCSTGGMKIKIEGRVLI